MHWSGWYFDEFYMLFVKRSNVMIQAIERLHFVVRLVVIHVSL